MILLIIAIDQPSKLVVLANKHNHNDADPAAFEKTRDQGAVGRGRDWLLDVDDFRGECAQERSDGAGIGERENVFEGVGCREDRGCECVRGGGRGEGACCATGWGEG